jgi:fructose-bisphosphate aldolase class I
MSLRATARALVEPGKGILAADESHPTMAKRLEAVGLPCNERLRRDYRELLVSTAGLSDHISGVILFDETIRQGRSSGVSFAQGLLRAGMVPGIKVDGGLTPLPHFPDEVITQGLDGLPERLAEYADLGARFAKWRAVIHIGAGRPSATCVSAHAHGLARFAAAAQEHGLVPVVEPEVMMGGTHDIDRCAAVTSAVLRGVYDQLARHRVDLAASLLKVNMILPGSESEVVVGDREIAEATIAVLRDTVPASVPGIVFLSGGQSPLEATARLDAINRCAPQPWELSFSFGRALQAPVLEAWAGRAENRGVAQAALLERARMNGLARRGRWNAGLEPSPPPLVA